MNNEPPVAPPKSVKRSRVVKPKAPALKAKAKPVVKGKGTREASASTVKRRMRLIEGKRAAILDAALEIFSRFGLHGTSLDQVASMADVSKTNLLYYFASKEELYTSVLRQLLDVWLKPLRGFSAEQDPVEAISEYIRVKLELSRDHPAESRLFCLEIIQGAPLMLAELEQPLRDIVEAKVSVIQGWIEAGKLAPVEPHHLIFSLWATTQHYADFASQINAVTGKTLDDPVFFAQTLENLRALILNGICPR
ncbi:MULTISPECIES: HTH-type transcriptional regulator RutR [Pseudomonas]|uniref:HTH-type transcriptional regulator RutR n=1 Tax=Pseudomonas TaxID=286 RepID=UPI0004869FF2|nr:MULTISPECIES: HTH-type transcriptional regulator RutR [Pseudomonas]MCQ2993496.1 HTH-type transcriptional regulator RutR [Pseudomonas syringae]MCD5990912.1 HTH-type transcriptional regulator RutR [Pseudomonas quasicaspiana]MCQ3002222.1 HTH-type transcriptional regulator RutR [Pseudomonas syringae]MCQ3029706.1 HTH-type transcriptional regulator RutR [Pseudomonas syringae]MDG6398775.1 HTH-type transcriptional regulator RutR [Pseudomonas quasicaspiana]